MLNGSSAAFRRAVSKRDLFRGEALLSAALSLIGTLLLCLLLLDGFLVADLLATGGVIDLAGDAELVARLTGLAGTPHNDPDTNLVTPAVIGGQAEGAGILPTVWWCRDTVFGPALATLYRNIPQLQHDRSALAVLALTAVVLGLLRSLCLARARRLAERVADDVATRLRRSLHRQALRLGPSDLLDEAGERVLGLFTQEVERVRKGVSLYVYRLGGHILRFGVLLLLALLMHWLVTLQSLIPLGACWYFAHRERRRSAEAARLADDRAGSELRILAESLQKTRLVRGYGMEEFEQRQFEKSLSRFQRDAGRVQRGERIMRALGRVLMVVAVSLIAYLMGMKIIATPHDLSFAAALFLAAVFVAMYRPAEMLYALRRDRDDAATAADTIYRYLDRRPEVGQAVGARFLQPLTKSLRFDGVSYRPPGGKPLLDALDLQIPAGETVALLAIDPLEAKALVSLLPRFIEPQKGKVLYDGEDTAWATLESLRAETAYVAADPGLTGTIRENIACGREGVALQHVTEAAKTAHAHQFIQRLPQGYETQIGEHGERLDAGQAFRLGLARAALVNPAVLVVEEPNTRLDDDTKHLLDDAYNRLFAGRTVLVLPTRLSTVKKADRVIVLFRGKVDAVGKHAELVKSCEVYRHWEYLRFNEYRDPS